MQTPYALRRVRGVAYPERGTAILQAAEGLSLGADLQNVPVGEVTVFPEADHKRAAVMRDQQAFVVLPTTPIMAPQEHIRGSTAFGIATTNLSRCAETSYIPNGSGMFAPKLNNDPVSDEKQTGISHRETGNEF